MTSAGGARRVLKVPRQKGFGKGAGLGRQPFYPGLFPAAGGAI